jgi:hypothetical protein
MNCGDWRIHTANPIHPSPNIATVDPGSTFAVFQAAPTPKNGSKY